MIAVAPGVAALCQHDKTSALQSTMQTGNASQQDFALLLAWHDCQVLPQPTYLRDIPYKQFSSCHGLLLGSQRKEMA